MELLIPLLGEVARKYMAALASPLYLLLIIFIGWQYKRIQQGQLTAGWTRHSRRYLHSTLVATLAGILGGFLGSVLLILLGIDIAGLGLIYLFVVALVLMMIHPRFLCFAYAGGLLSILSIITGFPSIQVAHVMALVAILHMVESLLIFFTGHLDPIPVYFQAPGQKMVGGFNLQKFWPIPLVAVMSTSMVSFPGAVDNWWPILSNPEFYDGIVYGLVPVMAILGYGEVTTTALPVQRSRSSALYLAIFSVTLLGLAVLGSYYPSFLILAALFGPLGHEMVIAIGWRSERFKNPIYTSPPQGLMVLDVIHGSPAQQAGVRSQDIVIELNGNTVYGPADLIPGLDSSGPWLTMTVIRDGQRLVLSTGKSNYDYLGIIPVPDSSRPTAGDDVTPDPGFLMSLFLKLKKFW